MDLLKPLFQFSPRQLALQFLNFTLVVSSALMVWKGVSLVLNTESPIVVVLSESMEPAFQRGDLLFLELLTPYIPLRVGDICVYKLKGKDIPIVHRILEFHENQTPNNTLVLTKGDNNPVDDRGLYNPGQYWLQPEDIIGRVLGHVPYLGMFTIILNDYPQFKYLLLALMSLSFMVSREEAS